MAHARPRKTARLALRVASLAVAALVTVACNGGGSDRSSERDTTTTTGRPTTTALAEEAAVEAAYRAFWDAYLQAADPMNPEHPALAQHATGKELEQLQRSFLALASAGEVIRGTLDLAPRVVSVTGTSARITDCYLDNTGVYDAGGTRKDAASGVRHLIDVELVLEGGRWKVARIAREGDGCEPGRD